MAQLCEDQRPLQRQTTTAEVKKPRVGRKSCLSKAMPDGKPEVHLKPWCPKILRVARDELLLPR